MTIELNGKPTSMPEGASLADAITALGGDVDRRGVAAAVDGEVVRRPEWEGTMLREGQAVEIVQAVQGG
jgi:sulfur carrier protein